MKKLVFACFTALLVLVSFSARADGFNDCLITGAIIGGIADMNGSKHVGGAAIAGCGAGAIAGRVLERRDSAPVYAPPPDYQYPQPRRQQAPVYIYQDQQRPVEVYVPPACEKYSNDQGKLNRCVSVYEQEQLRLANEARHAADIRRQAEMRGVEEEARQAARSGY